MSSHASPEVIWHCRSLSQLDPHCLYALLRLRVDVFVVEQACAYPELDGKDCDPAARQVLGLDQDGTLLACARLLPPGLSFELPSIGRVAVAPAARGHGLAHRLMEESIGHARGLWPGQALALAAQAHLRGYYERHGFVVCSGLYLEDGIPHLDMQRPDDQDPTAE